MLSTFHTLNSIFVKAIYDDQDKATMQGLQVARPKNKHLELRKICGQLLAKKSGEYKVVANGRADWVGWIELKEKEINDKAIINTARVWEANS